MAFVHGRSPPQPSGRFGGRPFPWRSLRASAIFGTTWPILLCKGGTSARASGFPPESRAAGADELGRDAEPADEGAVDGIDRGGERDRDDQFDEVFAKDLGANPGRRLRRYAAPEDDVD